MPLPMPKPRKATERDLLFFATPVLWPVWPYLPLIRHRPNGDFDCGLLYDGKGCSGRSGFGTTVFLSNFFEMPDNEAQFLALPHETYASYEEMAEAGWVVD